MTRRQYRALHKWIFIFMSAFILIWLISGILIVTPTGWSGAASRHSMPAVNYRNASLSPAEAIKRLEQHTDTGLDIRNIQLQQINDQLLYRINAKGSKPRHIDAVSGEYFEFTPELAEDIARSNFDIDAPLLEITRLTAHDTSYLFGELPVFRIRFENNPDASYFVSESNGRVSRHTLLSRIRSVIVSLHAFEPVEMLTHSKSLRKTLLVLTCTISLLGALIGIYLTLPAGRKNRQTAD